MKYLVNATKFIRSESLLCTKYVQIALHDLTFPALPENCNMGTHGNFSASEGHKLNGS
jgi:hypothetical protein